MSHEQSTTVGQRSASVQFHGNVWNEELILSLSSSYSEAQYLKQADSLAAEIRRIIADQSRKHSPHSDLIECLELVHALQSLGIHKYFTYEIKHALDYVYRFWNDEKGVGFGSGDHAYPNLLSTALAFRILRFNGYHVTARAIGTFHREKCFEFRAYPQRQSGEPPAPALTSDETYARSILTLFCASSLSFSEEKTLQEAEHFSTQYLKKWLKQTEYGTNDDNLIKEVKFVLEFPRHCSPPLWQARHYIDIYQLNPSWISLSLNKKILELGRLDFNIKQAVYQQEMKEFLRWWSIDEIPKLSYMRIRPLECYFYAAMAIPDPEYTHARMALAKATILGYALDDTADNFATYSEYKRFYEAFDRGDLSMLETGSYPDEIKLVLKFATKLVQETALTANGKFGSNVTPFLKIASLGQIQAYLKELKWNEIKYIPSFEENLEVSALSAGMRFLSVYALVSMDAEFEMDKYTHIFHLGGTVTRLADDLTDFEDTNKPSHEVNVVESFLTYNPRTSHEDASSYIRGKICTGLKEINLWYFQEDSVPVDCKIFCYNICRVVFFALHMVDGYTYTGTVIREQMTKILLLPA